MTYFELLSKYLLIMRLRFWRHVVL